MSDKPVGLKYDADKVNLSLLPSEVLEEVARVLMFGALKYKPYNWTNGINYTRVYSASLRHLAAFMDKRQTLDRDENCTGCQDGTCLNHSNRHHVAAAIVNLMFLLSYDLQGQTEFDDRRPPFVKKPKV